MKTNSLTLTKISTSALVVLGLALFFGWPQGALAQTNVLNSTGNAGIGTTGPGDLLEVKTAANDVGMTLRGATTSVSPTFKIADSGGTVRARIGIAGSAGNLTSGSAASDLVLRAETRNILFTTDGGANPLLFLGSGNGNVGIGTGSPGTSLDVKGDTGITISGSNQNAAYVLKRDYATGYMHFVGGQTGYSGFRFFTDSTSDKVTFMNNGNVGIGSTNPGLKLEVYGVANAHAAYFYNPAAAGTSFGPLIDAGGNSSDATLRVRSRTGTDYFFIRGDGNVGIGTVSPQYKLDVAGTINSNSTITGTNIVAKYQDVAEWVPSSEQITAGTVVVLDATKSNQVISSTQAYDTRVAGVVSEKPGIALGESGANKVLVATTGRVLVKVDASNGPIHIGDLLVTSDIPGLAMKSEPITIGNRKIHTPGTLIGKALEPLEKGSGKILVLLSLQ